MVRWGEPPMLKLAKNTTAWEQEHRFRESRSEKKSEYLSLRNPRVYIGELQLSSRLLALNGILCLDL